MRPACGPDCTTLIPPGIVLQYESAWACGDVITVVGRPNVFPPSLDALTQTWLGPKSWYVRYTWAVSVLPPLGMYASTHWRSTKNGCPQAVPPSRLDSALPRHVTALADHLHTSR